MQKKELESDVKILKLDVCFPFVSACELGDKINLIFDIKKDCFFSSLTFGCSWEFKKQIFYFFIKYILCIFLQGISISIKQILESLNKK